MKKVFMYFLLALLLSGFISATPTKCNSMIKVLNSGKIQQNENYGGSTQPVVLDIHPLDILALKLY
jgi:hypothetical protein